MITCPIHTPIHSLIHSPIHSLNRTFHPSFYPSFHRTFHHTFYTAPFSALRTFAFISRDFLVIHASAFHPSFHRTFHPTFMFRYPQSIICNNLLQISPTSFIVHNLWTINTIFLICHKLWQITIQLVNEAPADRGWCDWPISSDHLPMTTLVRADAAETIRLFQCVNMDVERTSCDSEQANHFVLSNLRRRLYELQ